MILQRHISPRLPTNLPPNDQTLPTRTLRLNAMLSPHGIPVLELVREAMVGKRVAGLLGDLDLAGDEDGGEGLLDDGPEDGDGGADDG